MKTVVVTHEQLAWLKRVTAMNGDASVEEFLRDFLCLRSRPKIMLISHSSQPKWEGAEPSGPLPSAEKESK